MTNPDRHKMSDLILTALAPAIWGSTYLVTTELLPAGYPLTVAFLRALPAGLLLLLLGGQLPKGRWWGRIMVLGALNFSIFWTLLFVAAYRLPGGVAATLGAAQPLIVVFLARLALGTAVRLVAVMAAIAGLAGVALLVLSPTAIALDPVGIVAGLGGALSMAAGTILTRKWQPKASLLTFTAWQLTAGGVLLLPLAFWFEPSLPPLTGRNIAGFAYLGLIGAAFTYFLWFRGIARLEPAGVATLGLFSPMTAVLLGWIVLGQGLGILQMLGMGIVLVSVWLSQRPAQLKNSLPAAAFWR